MAVPSLFDYENLRQEVDIIYHIVESEKERKKKSNPVNITRLLSHRHYHHPPISNDTSDFRRGLLEQLANKMIFTFNIDEDSSLVCNYGPQPQYQQRYNGFRSLLQQQ